VSYKGFIGGQSALKVDSIDYITNATYYGMFPISGLSSLDLASGVSLFLNATLPFQVASSLRSDRSEPPLPQFPQPYGYNVLLLNETSTAVLDIPQPSFLTSVQELLAIGESWVITAPVIATVATLNSSKTKDPAEFNSFYTSACDEGKGLGDDPWSWSFTYDDMYNGWSLSLLDRKDLSDQSMQYIGLAPGFPECADLPEYVQLFNAYRQQCQGTWSITRAGIQLMNGSCSDVILSSNKQQVIAYNELILSSWYMPSLMETLATFSGGGNGNRGNHSSWMIPSMTTSVAAMLWARVTTINIPDSFNSGEVNMSAYGWTTASGTRLTYGDIDIVYPVNETAQSIFYTRPTLQKSGLLYLIFAVQPLLIVIVLGLTALLHSSPLSSGFGLVSILSGVRHETLHSLAGASLSGELSQPVKLIMTPIKNGQTGVIEYRTEEVLKAPGRNGKLVRNIIYH
jgi:hypothetical protein